MSSKHKPANPESDRHVKHRETARILLSNERAEIFLIQTHWDPGTGLPPRWLTPGGGIDAGESVEQAAIRELFEETGMVVTAADLGDLVHRIDFRVDWANNTYETGVAHFYALMTTSDFVLDKSHWTIDEHRDVIDYRWWSVSELKDSGALVGPPGLLDYLEHHFQV